MTGDPPVDRPAGSPGVAGALQRLATAFVALAGTRAELASTEFDELSARYRQLLALAVAAAVMFTFGLAVLTLLVVVAFWDTYRIPAIVAMLVLYGGVGTLLALRARKLAAAIPRPFSATLEELRRDVGQLLRLRQGAQR